MINKLRLFYHSSTTLGYRYDLEGACGEFSETMESQGGVSGYLPEKRLSLVEDERKAEVEKALEGLEDEKRIAQG